jgi:hypothetical protein
MMTGLGRFGDGRLEKGGSFFWKGCCVPARAGSVCALWAATGRARFGSIGS